MESNEGGRRRAGHKAMAKYHPANQPGYAMGIGERTMNGLSSTLSLFSVLIGPSTKFRSYSSGGVN